MPYVITTRTAFNDPRLACCGRDAADCDCESPVEFPTRTAVATLDEAREVALEAVRVSDYRGEWMLPHIRATNDLATNDGGTIGPLPDGTVIEVRPITWYGLAENAGIRGQRFAYITHPAYVHAYENEILEAFNAR